MSACSEHILCDVVDVGMTECRLMHLDQANPVLDFAKDSTHTLYLRGNQGEQAARDCEGIKISGMLSTEFCRTFSIRTSTIIVYGVHVSCDKDDRTMFLRSRLVC